MNSKKSVVISVLLALCMGLGSSQLLDANEIGFNGQTRSQNYDALINALYAPGIVTTTIGDNLWVPWFTTSSSCQLNDLHQGASCNSGQTIDLTHNCMVSDEFSQVGLIVSMGKNQTRMNQFYNTLDAIASDKGQLPGWRIYRDGNSIQPCRPGINGNCDTASDADARIIMSLFIAAANPYFTDGTKKAEYFTLASALAEDFVQYDVLYNCKPSSLGQGDICYWLAAGAHAKTGGMGSTDFAYTGYYSDAISAMLAACTQLENQTYCDVADDFVLNYLQASNYNSNSFTVPPGRSFKWTNLNGVPIAQCTGSCSPVVWDYADASRAVGLCQANYYADMSEHELPLLDQYCATWRKMYMGNPTSAPIQYYPSGQALNYQSGYFAQGLEALHHAGALTGLFEASVDSALSHYVPSTQTWDWTSCFGVYMQSLPMRALGFGIGRDLGAFTPIKSDPQSAPQTSNSSNGSTSPPSSSQCYTNVQNIPPTCIGGQVTTDTWNGCRTIMCTAPNKLLQVLACNKPDGAPVPGYFEMYKQQQVGSGLEICLTNTTCISNNGFAQSPSFPLCVTGQNTTPPSSPPVTGVASYAYTCTYNGQNCNLVSDVTQGVCRTIVSGTPNGIIQVLACTQANNIVEVYRQQYPVVGTFQACVHTGCVNNLAGFASFVAP